MFKIFRKKSCANTSQKTILIIDDDPGCIESAKNTLEKTGKYKVLSELGARQGLICAKKISPDAILLDIIMPHVNGLRILEKLKKNIKTMHIPVIVLTSLIDGCSKMEALRLYGDSCLEKPVDSALLLTTIERVFQI
jgi:PleD family two-component response regulator